MGANYARTGANYAPTGANYVPTGANYAPTGANDKESRADFPIAVRNPDARARAQSADARGRGRFDREAMTVPHYRLWSINDRHPAMIRVRQGGVAAAGAVEVWRVPETGSAQLLIGEPPGLCIGKVRLADGEETLGVHGEPTFCEGQREITSFGGWRAYIAAQDAKRA